MRMRLDQMRRWQAIRQVGLGILLGTGLVGALVSVRVQQVASAEKKSSRTSTRRDTSALDKLNEMLEQQAVLLG